MNTPPFHQHIVEEADVGICADGWDNFLLYDTSELEEYVKALRYMNATRCAAVVQEVLDLVTATKPARPIDLTDSHKALLEALWHRYDAASCAENPQDLARQLFDHQC